MLIAIVTSVILGSFGWFLNMTTRMAVLEAKVSIMQEVIREVALWKK